MPIAETLNSQEVLFEEETWQTGLRGGLEKILNALDYLYWILHFQVRKLKKSCLNHR